jgi:excisionase family DNA binding protein
MVNDIRAYRSAHKDGQWLTMSEAAAKLGVNNHRIRRLIEEGLLPAKQGCRARRTRFGRAICWISGSSTLPREQIARVASMARTISQCFQSLNKVGHYEQAVAMGRIWFSTQLLSIGRSPSSM